MDAHLAHSINSPTSPCDDMLKNISNLEAIQLCDREGKVDSEGKIQANLWKTTLFARSCERSLSSRWDLNSPVDVPIARFQPNFHCSMAARF